MQTLLIEFRITDAKAWESLDGDQERQEVTRLIDDALKRAEAGKWTGSAQRRTSILFYCQVKDEVICVPNFPYYSFSNPWRERNTGSYHFRHRGRRIPSGGNGLPGREQQWPVR